MTPTDSQAARLPAWAIAQAFQELDDCGTHSSTECGVYNRIFNRALELSRSENGLRSVDSAADTRPSEQGGVVDEWRPIETAPQGVMILLADMTATEARHWAFVGWKHHWNKDGHVETPSAINRRATHWKHLPQPPALAAALGRTNG